MKMVESFKTKLLKFFAQDYFEHLRSKEKGIDEEVNRRVAEIVSRMDPFEPLLKEYHGIFSDYFERIEEDLDQAGKTSMAMWAWGQSRDPFMKRMIDWVMNTAGNTMLKTVTRSNEERGEVLMWGKAQIVNMILFKREMGRLAAVYEEILEGMKGDSFDEDRLVE